MALLGHLSESYLIVLEDAATASLLQLEREQ